RSDDFAARGVVLGIGTEHQRDIEGQAHRITLNLDIAFLHDVEQAHLNFSGKVRQFVHGEDASVCARQQTVVNGQLAGEFMTAPCSLDRINVTDEISDGHIGSREFLDIAFFGREVSNRATFAALSNEVTATAANRSVRIVVNFAAGKIWHMEIKQRSERPQNTALSLTAESKKNEVVPGED